jgi:hypothetical protein
MKQTKKHKPKYLSLDVIAKTAIIEDLESNTPNENSKQIAKECMLFADEVEHALKRSDITLSKIKKLFELQAEKLKKLQLNQ